MEKRYRNKIINIIIINVLFRQVVHGERCTSLTADRMLTGDA